MENYREALKKNSLWNQIWVQESVTRGEGISTPTTPVLSRFPL